MTTITAVDARAYNLTPADVSMLFHVNSRTVARWASEGMMSSVRTPGGHRRFREDEVMAILAEHTGQRREPATRTRVRGRRLRSLPVDGFLVVYDRHGAAGDPAVVLLHGWPGDRSDYAGVVERLVGVDVVVPDLRGFGASDKPAADPAAYSADAQADSIIALIEELDLHRPVLAGYDIGSRIAQTIARRRPDLVSALVVSPPLPGIGDRILAPSAQREFWYQSFHQLDLATQLVDGRPDAVRTYLRHFWTHWSGPDFVLDDARLEHLVDVYARPGAFTASVNWYRAGAGAVALSVAEPTPGPDERITVPTTVLWQTHDPLFPLAWSDRLDRFFTDAHLVPLDGAGHFTPVERPAEFAAAAMNGIEAARSIRPPISARLV